MNRRRFAQSLAAAVAAACSSKQGGEPPTILVRSGWQTANIGDIAHTPGLLAILEKYLPEARLILWSNATDRGVREMLLRRFPKLEIVSGESETMGDIFEQADFLLHGSGPSVVARNHLRDWRGDTGKPFGIFGVTVTTQGEAASQALDDELKELLEEASFVFTRETTSLGNLQRAGVRNPKLEFVPDGTFSLDLANDAAATRYLAEHKLETKEFACFIPRLRLTPYHKIRQVDWTEDEIRRRETVNATHAEPDHAKMREAIVAWVRETGRRVLLCPEMTYQVELLGPLLYDPLPEDVKPSVVRREDYWLTDEAASVYHRAAAVVSFECHSPIMAAANGTPCMYLHQPEDGIKGQMWNDVGLGDWKFEIEETTGARIAETLLGIEHDRLRAESKVREAVLSAQGRHHHGAAVLGAALQRKGL
jgi:polysaccharide pyruvyl transferase WcaK-like protein